MKNIIITIVAMGISINLLAQNPCYIKYTYDNSGNRIKREFICAPVDTIINDGTQTVDDNCCPSAKMANNNSNNNSNNNNNLDFEIVPNPVHSEVKIITNQSEIKIKGAIFNNLGQQLFEFEVINNIASIDMSEFSAGIYYAVLNTEKKKMIKKFVKTD